MPVGNTPLPTLHPVPGIRLGTTAAGIKTPNHQDLVVMELNEGARVAGVYTRNAFCAAPVQIAKSHQATAASRYLLVNTGNANAGTGQPGLEAALQCCTALAELTDVETQQVLPFSTGVIGEPLPTDRICQALPAALDNLDEHGWEDAANGILTTDTRPKGASVKLDLGGREVTITGISKGAGMIKPNMATMLAFVATDAAIPQQLLQSLLDEAKENSFNRITVDGDTSTNDACMLAATGASGVLLTDGTSEHLSHFREALNELMMTLAQAIIRDGEGATKFVTVHIQEAASEAEALQVAYIIAESPLVKTALFASDPNWGRILAAVGRAGLDDLDINNINIWLGDVCIVRDGGLAPEYTEAAGAAIMAQEEIEIRVSLSRGNESVKVWTTDLSYDYVKINAEYRT